MNSTRYSVIRSFFKENYIFQSNALSGVQSKYFLKLMVLQSNRVLVLMSAGPQDYNDIAVEEFSSVANYNDNVADGSLRLDWSLIDRIRTKFQNTMNLKFSAKNRLSQLKFMDLGGSSEELIFDAFLPSDPQKASDRELVRISLFDEGFVTDRSFAQLPKPTATPHQYRVQLGGMGEFDVITQKTKGLFPKILHFIDFRSNKVLQCERLLIRAIQ